MKLTRKVYLTIETETEESGISFEEALEQMDGAIHQGIDKIMNWPDDIYLSIDYEIK